MSSTPESLGSKTVRSVSYKAIARFVSYGLQGLTTVVLAQNLSAKDYGIVGYATIFIGFLASFNDVGVGSAIVQRKQLDDLTLDTAFVLRIGLGLAAFAAAWLVAPFAGSSFGDAAVTSVIRLLSVGFLIGILGFIPRAILQREMEFGRCVVAALAGSVFRATVACILAVRGFGYWSIVVGTTIGSMAEVFCFMCFSKNRIQLNWSKGVAKELVGFGLPLFATGLLTFALFNTDNFIIGSVAGASMLGYYALAFNWGSIFSLAIYDVLHSVLFPAFARIQNDPALLRRMYLNMMEQLAVIGVLVQAGILACSRDFLVVVLGNGAEKWLPACHALQILSVYGLIRLLIEPLGNVVIALGRTNLLLRANLLATLFEIAFLYPALKFGGIEGVAVLVTVSYSLQCAYYWPFLSKYLDLRAKDLRNLLFPSLAAAALAVTGGLFVSHALPVNLASLCAEIATVTFIFIVVQGVLSSWRWTGAWRTLLVNRKLLQN